jgi:hypothetical protein
LSEEAVMTISAEGIIKGRRIELNHPTNLPDGARVRLHIETSKAASGPRRQAVAELFGSCADDPTFLQSMVEVERRRHAAPPREVNFDVAP